jgi:Secretion system C-terminal sorting domain
MYNQSVRSILILYSVLLLLKLHFKYTIIFLIMKKTNLAIALFCAASLIFTAFAPQSSGGKVGYSGAPSEGNCTSCHSGTVNSGTGSVVITSNIPSSGYVAGTTYQVNVTVTQAQITRFGLDAVALNSSGAVSGTLSITNATETQLLTAANGAHVTHKTNGGASTTGTKMFTFGWTAPATSTGVVTFYASGLAANANGGTTGDFVYTTNKAFSPAAVATTIAITGNTAVCAGACTALTATASPAGNFTYTWSNGSTGATTQICPTANTTYTVSASTPNGVVATQSVTVTVKAAPVPVMTGSSAICAGQIAQIGVGSAAGGTFSNYLWSNQATTQIITVTPTVTTTYTATVTNADGCTASATRIVTVNAAPTPVFTQIGSLCNGAVALIVDGGLTYAWSVVGASGNTASVNAAGVYTVTVTNANGCTATKTITVAACTPSAVVFTGNTVVCPDSCTTITASVPNNTSVLTYTWSNNLGAGATKLICLPTPPTTGVYSVTATNSAGTIVASGSVTVTPAQVAQATITGTTNLCLGSTTTLSANPNVAGFTYRWNNGVTTRNLSVMPTTNTIYTCTVTNTSGCISTASVSVTLNSAPTFTVAESGSLCSPNGMTLTATAGAGTTNTYAWSNQATGSMITVNVAGVYTVTATNTAGCTTTRAITVTQPTPPTATITQSGTLCTPNGVLLTATTNGTTANSFVWSNNVTTATNNVQNAGVYTVIVTNSAGCTATATVAVVACATITVGIGGTNTVCGPAAGSTTGGCTTISASASSSNPSNTYTYFWSNQATTASFTACPIVTTIYTVTATANTGATATASYQVTVNPAPVVTITQSVPLCGNNATVLTATGGGTYSWGAISGSAALTVTSAGTYTVTVTSALGCTATKSIVVTLQTVPTLAVTQSGTLCTPNGVSLTATTGFASYTWNNSTTAQTNNVQTVGVYTVTATTQAGCSRTASTVVAACTNLVVSITGDLRLCATTPGTIVSCTNLIAAVTGGTAPYTYSWSTQATTATVQACPTQTTTYTVIATASTGATGTASFTVTVNPQPVVTITQSVPLCGNNATVLTATGGGTYSWGAASSSASLTVTAAGTYTVTVTSALGCTATKSIVVTQSMMPQPAITQSGTLCSPNGVSLTATTGFATYIWSNNSTAQTNNVQTAGVYTITVTNAAGCTGSASTVVAACANITVAINGATSICAGTAGTAACTQLTAAVTSSTGTYTYSWSNQTNTQITQVCPTLTTTYTVTATAATTGATGTASFTVTVNPRPAVTFTGNTTLNCANPIATITAVSSVPNSTFAWVGSTSNLLTVTSAGVYTVTVTAPTGCTTTQSVTVTTDFSAPNASAGADQVITCANSCVTIGSVAPTFVNYIWSNGAITATQTVCTAGTYTVIVTNSLNGCTATDQVVVTSNRVSPTATLTSAGNLTCTRASTTLTAGSNGLTASYLWSNQATTPTITVTAAGTYTVIITNPVNGCTASSVIVVTQNTAAPVITIAGATSFCAGSTNTLTASATTNATFMWNAAVVSPTITLQAGGTYTVTATNADNGCTATKSVTVTVKALPTVAITQPSTPCVGQATSLLASGGGTYLWNTQATTASITIPAATTTVATYTVTVTSTNGCSATATRKPQYLSGIGCTGTGGGGTGRAAGSSVENITLYPNPTDQYFNLVFGENGWTDATITVTDLTGKTITTLQKASIAQSETISFATSDWTAGVYFVTISSKDRLQTLKVVKMQ